MAYKSGKRKHATHFGVPTWHFNVYFTNVPLKGMKMPYLEMGMHDLHSIPTEEGVLDWLNRKAIFLVLD
jgi:hypothetical protein